MVGKLGDNAVILIAAILTICGFALVFMPWQALYQHAPAQQPVAVSDQTPAPGEVLVGIGTRPPKKPQNR